MGSTTLTTPFKDQTHYSLAKKLLPWTIYAFFPIVIFRLYFYPLQLPQSSRDRFSNTTPIIITSSSTLSLAPPPRFSPPPHLSPHKGTCILIFVFEFIPLKFLLGFVMFLCFGIGILLLTKTQYDVVLCSRRGKS